MKTFLKNHWQPLLLIAFLIATAVIGGYCIRSTETPTIHCTSGNVTQEFESGDDNCVVISDPKAPLGMRIVCVDSVTYGFIITAMQNDWEFSYELEYNETESTLQDQPIYSINVFQTPKSSKLCAIKNLFTLPLINVTFSK